MTIVLNIINIIILLTFFREATYGSALSQDLIASISKNLRYYETIHADRLEHRIVKRGLQESNHPYNKITEVNFKTLGRDFRLILTPKRSVLHSKFKAYSVDANGKETSVHIDHDVFYGGRVFGEISSHASIHIDNGVMTGIIQTPQETYHIEPSWRHLPSSDNRTMITYRSSDVKFSWHDHNPSLPLPKTCGYVKEGVELDGEDSVDDFHDDLYSEKGHDHREKRQIDQYEYTPTKTKCSLLLVADYRFYREMGGGNIITTISYLLSLIDRVDKIYNDTIWQDRQEIDGLKGMGFVIKKMVVHNVPTNVLDGEEHYNMVREKWNVHHLLKMFSRLGDNKNFCLAHLFTHNTFEEEQKHILGLSYVASHKINKLGGICSEYFKNGYTLYLNSGLSSSRNHYGQRVITGEADLVTAHEFGHSWGSGHDNTNDSDCSPSDSQGGSYLMHTYGVSGHDVNNKRFSPCSIQSIRRVLQAKSGRCFSALEESFCGNLRVEGDEECDAGLLGTEDNDVCCDEDCKLRRIEGAVCSDKNSPCCQNCKFLPQNTKCREAQFATCEQESKCTGTQAECLRSAPLPDDTDCQERGKCRAGKCTPYCEATGLQSCMCDIIENACKRCCRVSINETCSPVEPADVLPDGTLCIQGFCNKGNCDIAVQDFIERFWDINEDRNINKVLLFLKDNIVGMVVLVTALIWIPASYGIGYVDRRLRREVDDERLDWERRRDLISPIDHRRLIHIRVPRRRPKVSKVPTRETIAE